MDNRLTDGRSEYSRMFASHVPFELAVDMARVARDATRQAFAKDIDLLPGARRDKFPIDRRALTETGFHHLAEKYKGHGVVAKEKKNATGNCSHVEVVSGRVVIIPAAVETDESLVRDAKYRKTLASSPQLALPLDGEISQHPSDALLAVVLYGPSSTYPKTAEQAEPGFVVVRFPTPDWSCYAEGRIDLLCHFSFAQSQQKPPIEIALWPEEMAE